MPPVRVLLVDDSAVIRRLLRDTLSEDPDIEVVATAPNGKIALDKLPLVQPDVVVLDIEMPVMNGLETLPRIRDYSATLPVIMFSTLTTHGGQATLDALALGATDYVAKPSNSGGVAEGIERVRTELVPKVKALGGRHTRPVARVPLPPAPSSSLRPRGLPEPPVRAPARPPRTARQPIAAVVIGVSTGGPKALTEVVPRLPSDFPVPVLIVQHMPPLFTKALADRLDSQSALRVTEAADGMAVRAGEVLVAPGDRHMIAARDGASVVVRLTDDPPEHSCRPAVDPLFRSAATVWGGAVLAVVMTGMGHDGCIGAGVIAEHGGVVLAQDEASSVVWGMPGFVVKAGLADAVVPLGDLAREITNRVALGARARTLSQAGTS